MPEQTKLKIPKMRRQYHSIFAPVGGLKYDLGSTLIDEKQTPKCSEVVLRESIVSKARGTSAFASTDTTPLDEIVMHLDQYYKLDGTDRLMCHTTKNTYRYNSTSELFECRTKGVVVEDCEDVWSVNAPTTCATDTDSRKGTNSVKITIPDAEGTGVCAYENFTSVDLSGYTYLHYYIKSDIATDAGDLDIRVSEENAGGTGGNYVDYDVPALTAGVWKEVGVALTGAAATRDAVLSVSLVVVVDSGAQVVNIDDVMCTNQLTGDEDNFFTSEIFDDEYIYHNGVDTIRYWDMGATSLGVDLPNATTYVCIRLLKFGGRLVLFGGSVYSQRVRWSKLDDSHTWSGTGTGYTDLDTHMGVDPIVGAEKIGNYVVIYGERTMVLMEYTGSAPSPFRFSTRVSGIGLTTPRAIVNLGEEHVFLGWDNIYSYGGGREAEPIAGGIREQLFVEMSPPYATRSFMVYIEEREEIRFFFVPIGETTPTKYMILSTKDNTWSRGVRSYTGYGYYTTKSTMTWDTSSGAWNVQTAKWDDRALTSLSPLTMYGNSSGVVYKDNEATKDLAGVAIDGYWDTKDFVTGDGYRRTIGNWFELNYEAKGDSVDVYYSVDAGDNYTLLGTQVLTEEWTKYSYDFEVSSEQIRFRFRNNTSGSIFDLRWFEVGFVEGSGRR